MTSLQVLRSEPVVPAATEDLAFIDALVARVGRSPEKVIPLLQAIQSHYNYLPKDALARVCQITDVTPASITSVSTFYAQFRHKPAGKHILRVCHGTACHVKGADLADDSIRRHLEISRDTDTDAGGTFTIERVGCIGCCTLAPVIQIGPVVYGFRTPENIPQALSDFLELEHHQAEHPKPLPPKINGRPLPEIHIGCGSCCVAGGALLVRNALEEAVQRTGAAVAVKSVGCVGMCHQTPLVHVNVNDKPIALYARMGPAEATAVVRKHFKPRGFFNRMRAAFNGVLDGLLPDESHEPQRHRLNTRDGPVCDFLAPQKRLATEHCGELDPLDLDEYLSHDGFKGSARAADFSPEDIIDTVLRSGLRGRGGAGFPTGQKWAKVSAAKGETKYLICNGDEGDPGAFMDRMILESFPYRVIEGMLIAARAVGATEGIFYIRHEYPLAVQRITHAIEVCRKRNLLTIPLRIVEGAGAFVCGEETALIASIEGRRGMPRLRPPFPAECGLYERPTCINNVETYALVPWILRNGPDAFAALGTEKSKGTKVFALTGKIRRGGLIEVPMGITLRQIVEHIGGGVPEGRTFKAVQIGGPSGGCIPASMADVSVDYESLAAAGAIMGSGGLVVLDDTDCMVDIARYFLRFTQAESCGKCTFCRIGTRVLLDTLDRLCEGKARPGDLDQLEELSRQVKAGSVCGLGQTAPNPVLTTLKYFRHEYEAHLKGHCPAGRCKALIKYVVNQPNCIGCTKCAQVCPSGAIEMKHYQPHSIDTSKCTRCDLCRTACPEKCIAIV